MDNFGPMLILLLLTSIGLHIHTSYRLRAMSRKMNWYRINAVKTNGMLRDLSDLSMNSSSKVGVDKNELDVNIGNS